MARLQQLTGAQLVASPAAAEGVQDRRAGGRRSAGGMHKPFRAARVDRIIQDGEEVRTRRPGADRGRHARATRRAR